MGEFFYSPKEPSYVVTGEDGRAHYGRRPRVVELVVPMCCTKCEEKVRENMEELDGVQGVMVDPITHRVTVTGFVDPMRTLKEGRKVHRDAQLLAGESHVIPVRASSKHHHRSQYRYRPSAFRASPISSSVVHLPASTFHSSYNRHTPASYGHHVIAHPGYDEMVITNPYYVKHIEHDGYWY